MTSFKEYNQPTRKMEYNEGTKNPLDTQVGGGHYKDMKIQPIEFISENNLSYSQGCIIKYICRYRDKNGIEDLEKIKHYVDLILKFEYGK